MPKYTVTALEKFIVKTTYTGVEAVDKEHAIQHCLGGKESYDSHEIQEGDEEWLQTLDVEEE